MAAAARTLQRTFITCRMVAAPNTSRNRMKAGITVTCITGIAPSAFGLRSTQTISTPIAMAIALLFEYRTRMEAWLTVPEQPAEVYRWLATQPRSVFALA